MFHFLAFKKIVIGAVRTAPHALNLLNRYATTTRVYTQFVH